MPELGGVLLAAGRGSRYGPEPKLLAPYRGRPLVRHAAEAALSGGLGPVVAVLGAHADAVRAALEGLDLECVENPNHAAGLSTSLRAGIAALPEVCDAAVVLLGDMPLVTGAHVARLATAFREAGRRPAAVVPLVGGRRGNPVLLNLRRLGPDIAVLTGDRGAGPLLAARPDVLEIDGDPAGALDIDTRDAFLRLTAGEA